MSNCTKCADLCMSRTQVVLPIIVGTPTICFLGEAPGKNEDKNGEPFCGAAGKWHKSVMSHLGIYNNYMIINTINCRPTKLSENGRIVNGKPSDTQIESCSEWVNYFLLKAYKLKLIILYGKYSIHRVLDVPLTDSVSKNVGKMHKRYVNGEIDVFTLFHPATLVYNKKVYFPEWRKHILTLKYYIDEYNL